ncbi:outer membrane transport energization protein TonB [Vogesella indigofera]|uniref:Outer membrane transport energization protein TonB n=1 Tax=Vogesella indigofera TaxID=45465 RepID=A0A495BKM5_VOGIN|nr:energy transducer TonB [Vogesella indigofera]RKQ61943.1 outer membrane transport energization protein TonB [Vogesella indigofera]
MESSFSRYTMLAAITAGHVGLLLSMSHAAPPAQPPQPLPMEMVTIPTPPAPDIRPQPPAPAKTATAKPRKAAPAPRPLPAPIKPSPKAITTDTRAEAVTSKTPAVAEAPVASRSEPAPPAPPAPVVPPTHIGGHLGNPRPVYPPLSIELGEAGAVGLRVAVSADGRAQEVSIARSSGFPRLDRAALQAVRNWRFRPATRGNEAIPYTYVFNVDFDLTKA